MVCWAKRSLTPPHGVVWCFALAHALAVGRRVWSQQGRQDEAAPIVAAFRVCLPPRPGCRFSRSLGPLARVLALVAYANGCRAGQLQGVKS